MRICLIRRKPLEHVRSIDITLPEVSLDLFLELNQLSFDLLVDVTASLARHQGSVGFWTCVRHGVLQLSVLASTRGYDLSFLVRVVAAVPLALLLLEMKHQGPELFLLGAATEFAPISDGPQIKFSFLIHLGFKVFQERLHVEVLGRILFAAHHTPRNILILHAVHYLLYELLLPGR